MPLAFTYKQRVASMLPIGIYTIPEISSAGETEETCTQKKIDFCVGRGHFSNNARGHIIGDTSGMIKLIFNRADKKLLGVSIIGESATELIHIGMNVLDKNRTIDEFIEQVFNYPTLGECYKYAAYDGLGKPRRAQNARRLKMEGHGFSSCQNSPLSGIGFSP